MKFEVHGGNEAPKSESGPNIDKLPELDLRQIRRSESPITTTEKGRTGEVESLQSWNNYTIVTIEDDTVIKIFDDEAKRLSDFVLPIANKNISVHWNDPRLVEKLKTTKGISGDHYYVNNYGYLAHSQVPKELMPFVSKALASKGSSTVQFGSSAGTTEFKSSTLAVVSDRYILVYSNEGVFSAFETKSSDGITLAPRNWKRIDPASNIPPELLTYAGKLEGSTKGYKELNDKYSAIITDIGINITLKGDKKPIFVDNTSAINSNVVIDPSNPNILYYSSSVNPEAVVKLDLSTEPSMWNPVEAKLPKSYANIRNLQLDPNGNFFLFYSDKDLVVLTKNTLEEVKKIPGLSHVNFDSQGRIRAVDKEGHLVIYEPNFSDYEQTLEKKRIERVAQGIEIKDIFEIEASKKTASVEGENLDHLLPLREKYELQISEVLQKVTTMDEAHKVRKGFAKLKEILRQQGLKANEIEYVIEGIGQPIKLKESEFASKEAAEGIALIKTKLSSGLSVVSVGEARAEMERLKGSEALLSQDLREEFHQVALELEQKSIELFKQRGGEVIKDIKGLIDRTKADLEGFTSKSQMDDWMEFRFPQLKSKLGALAKDVPLEADEAYKAVVSARAELQTIATEYEDKFKREYAKVREVAAERIGATVDVLSQDVDGLIDRLKTKGFTSRTSAEQYLDSSEAKKALETEIAGLAGNNPDLAKELERGLKVRISNALTEIERGGLTKVAETGQQMVSFGLELFPKWEAKVKKKVEQKVDLAFEEDVKSHGPGIKATDILGDVTLSLKGSDGHTEKVRLYEGWEAENDWRLGLLTYRGESIPPSYLTAKEFKEVRRSYVNWSLGKVSPLRKEVDEKRAELREIYSRRPKRSERIPELDEAWKKEYQEKLNEYAKFVADNHISLLKRIDQVKNEPEIEHTNGKGFVPEWQSHWVMDTQTEEDLGDMAKALKMQLDLQEGLLNLKGHAGTGKDVRIKMFCSLSNRPYFGIDGTKWTTEFELSEDVMLESKDGASQTVKVPSAVLNGITTPGAVVYFNEFNAMPEQAQIFLHALMDEKRSLTLKTSSGKTVKAHPSVLLVGSMNPGYPGTFDPQFATRSRMVSMEIDYPPMTRIASVDDKNQNPMYDSSEALRIARGVDSLVDLTYEASLEHNEFVKMWDKYVNGIDNGSPEPTSIQKFDMDVSLALVQFSNRLREDFIAIFEKTREARNALPVTQPVTGRELRRAAYDLSKMPPEEKATANPEAVARNLLDTYFLTHIDKEEDRDKIWAALNTWTSRKRVRA